MKVSVLIPTFNSGRHLAECLDSVLAQDFDDMEILVSDDGSTDDSVQVIAAYAARDPRIRWWQNPKNLGFTGNHNCCLQQARGEYVKFIHADDTLLARSAIRQMVAALDGNDGAVLAGCRQHLKGAKSRPMIFSQKSGVYDGRRMIVTSLEQNTNLIGQPTLTLFRRCAAQRGFDDRFVGHLDFEMWCHLLEQGDFAYLAADLATWRVHEDQQTAKLERTGSSRHEHLLFVETYYAKPWLKKLATRRMLFAQIYYLKKKYGGQADPVAANLLAHLTRRHFVWQWLKHKAARPVKKIGRKAGWSNQLLMPLSIFSCQ